MTPARLMVNRELIATKLPVVPENTGGTIPEERYKLYQEELHTVTMLTGKQELNPMIW